MKVREFEDAVWRIEGFRLVILTDPDNDVEDYGRNNAFDQMRTLADYMNVRVRPKIGEYQAVVLLADGTIPAQHMQIRNVWGSYP